MTSSIKAQYKWSADELSEALRMHLRYNSASWPIKFIRWLGAFMVFGCFFVILWGKQPILSSMPLAILGGFFLSFNHFIRWQFRRNFRSNPNKDVLITWVLTEEKLYSEGEGFDFNLAWRKVFQVIDSPKGFLIYPQKNLYYWIPTSGFANQAEIECIRQFAKSNAINFKRVS
jgi:hypothetical protein